MMNGNDSDKISMEDATAAMDIADTTTTTTENHIVAENEPPPPTTTTSRPVENTTTTTHNNNNNNNNDDDDDDTADMMDDINDDDDDEEEDDDDKQMATEDGTPTTPTASNDETYLCQAIGLKEEGNQQFQNGDYNQASRSYRRGITALKKIQHHPLDDQVQQLKLTLYTNWSTVSYKDQKYRVSVDMATKAIEIDINHVKALYRRALAYRKLGNLQDARTDLRNAITIEPNNTTCRKELISVKKELEDTIAKQKKSLAKAFHSSNKNGSSFLYDDKEELAKQREMEEIKKKKELEELQAKRKKQWEDECVSLMAKNETVLSFEEWDKQRQEKEDEEKKLKEKQRKAERKARKEERMKSSSSSSNNNSNNNNDNDDDDDINFTEAELAAMRGYKKTSDGRITSYFTRELSQEEKLQIGDIAPKRLVDTTNTNTNTNTISCHGNNNVIPGIQPLSDTSSSSPSTNVAATTTTSTSASVWNQAGTWEEKNTTEWCQTQLKQRILETMTGNAILSTKITKVDDLNGDASVVVVSGKKRYIFDFNVKCKYQIYDNSKMDGTTNKDDNDSGKVIASGTLRLPDICSTIHHEEVEVICESYKKVPPTHLMDMTNTIRQMLIDQVRMQIGLFVQDFNHMY